MTWNEAMDAFKRRLPVVFTAPPNWADCKPVMCSRIYEVGIRANQDGTFEKVVRGMDRNENCIYTGTPERFNFPGRSNG